MAYTSNYSQSPSRSSWYTGYGNSGSYSSSRSRSSNIWQNGAYSQPTRRYSSSSYTSTKPQTSSSTTASILSSRSKPATTTSYRTPKSASSFADIFSSIQRNPFSGYSFSRSSIWG